MKNIFAIALGGAIGACIRTGGLEELPALFTIGDISVNCLLINLAGCFILSLFTTLVLDVDFSAPLKLGIATGFCGALTTFSTLCKESAVLFTTVGFGTGFLYLATTVCCGLVAIFLGEFLGHLYKEKTRKEAA